jgi:N-formylglutamate amidohydrolase
MSAQKNIGGLVLMKCDHDGNQQEQDAPAEAQRRTRRGSAHANGHRELPRKLMRTKALLLAALRVWELKHRVTDNACSPPNLI